MIETKKFGVRNDIGNVHRFHEISFNKNKNKSYASTFMFDVHLASTKACEFMCETNMKSQLVYNICNNNKKVEIGYFRPLLSPYVSSRITTMNLLCISPTM